MNQYNRMARDAEAQFDFASHGSISRDHQGSRRKKQSSSKRSSKKSGGKKEKGEEVGFIAGGLPQGEPAQLSQVCMCVLEGYGYGVDLCSDLYVVLLREGGREG